MTLTTVESDHTAAVIAIMEAGDAIPYTSQHAKRVQSLPPAYNEITLEPRAGGTFRNARTGRTGYRLVAESRGTTYEKTQAMREAAFVALRGAELVVGGQRTTPLVFESSQPIEYDADAGRFTGVLLFTYVH